jgi:hypothetical protein
MIQELADGTVVAAYGPMMATIRAVKNGKASSESALLGVREAFLIQEQLARFSGVIRRNIQEVETDDGYPQVVNLMISSAKEVGDPCVTPLIAVAGSVADLVADAIFADQKVSLVTVNNGGDIAVRMREDAVVGIGIRPEAGSNIVSHRLKLDAKCNIGGVATSGFGGRSFTLGIASAAVAAATRASLADVAATLIGNAVDVDGAPIQRRPAREIDADTDIPDHQVTTWVGALSDQEVEAALANGITKALQLQDRGLITGAVVALRGKLRASGPLAELLQPI